MLHRLVIQLPNIKRIFVKLNKRFKFACWKDFVTRRGSNAASVPKCAKCCRPSPTNPTSRTSRTSRTNSNWSRCRKRPKKLQDGRYRCWYPSAKFSTILLHLWGSSTILRRQRWLSTDQTAAFQLVPIRYFHSTKHWRWTPETFSIFHSTTAEVLFFSLFNVTSGDPAKGRQRPKRWRLSENFHPIISRRKQSIIDPTRNSIRSIDNLSSSPFIADGWGFIEQVIIDILSNVINQ